MADFYKFFLISFSNWRRQILVRGLCSSLRRLSIDEVLYLRFGGCFNVPDAGSFSTL